MRSFASILFIINCNERAIMNELLKMNPNSELDLKAGDIIDKQSLKFGDPVQVKYEEHHEWQNYHFHSFWTDGRIQCIPNGKSAWSMRDVNGKQPHQYKEGDTPLVTLEQDLEMNFGASYTVTFNYWRLPCEVTDSGDTGQQEAYLARWGKSRALT